LIALDEVNDQNERAIVVAAAEAGPADGDCIERTVAQVWQKVLQRQLAAAKTISSRPAAIRYMRSPL
jgi:hypothetical protein